MNIEDQIQKIIIAHNFKLIEEKQIPHHHLKVYDNGIFRILMETERGQRFMYIDDTSADGSWFDMSIVRSFILNEEQLTDIIPIEDKLIFFENYYQQIEELFNASNYPTTKGRLNSLREKRASQMFPGYIPKK